MKEKKKIKTWKINDNNLKLIRNELHSINWETYLATNCTNTADVDLVFNYVHDKICDSVNKHAPMKEKTVNVSKLKNEPWMTAGIKCSSQKLKKMYKICLKPGVTSGTCEAYTLYRNCLNKVKRACKLQYYKNNCKMYKNNTRKLWEIINQSIGKMPNKSCVIDSLRVENVMVTDPKDIANELCNHYSKVGGKLSSLIPAPSTDKTTYVKKISRNNKSLFMAPTSKEEIICIIEQLPSKKSSGFDILDNILLKNIKNEIAIPLEIAFNQSLQMDTFSCLMKNAEVIPLYKNKEKDLCVNYRPISLLITMSKILEKIVYKRLYNFLDTNGQLFSSQYGFRSKHSCENAISELVGQIIKGQE